jgi:hypothetical protein
MSQRIFAADGLPRTAAVAQKKPRRSEARFADSDEVAWAIRDDLARDYEMMSPGFGASLALAFLGVDE